MIYGRNLPKNNMDRFFDTGRLFSHPRPQTPKLDLPKKKEEAKPKAEGEYKARLERYKKRKGIKKDATLKKDEQIEFTEQWFKYLVR
jgi:hypothetical protein